MEKVFFFILGIYALISTIYTLYIKIRNLESFNRFNSRRKRFVENFKYQLSKDLLKLKDPDTYDRLLYIKTQKHLLIVAGIFSLSYILFIPSSQNKLLQFFAIVSLSIIFYGIGVYMNHSSEDTYYRYMIYGIQLSIILAYSFSFLVGYLEFGENMILFISLLLFPLVYSFILLKNVMSNFKSTLFQLFNFIFILGAILFLWGLSFGSFYMHHNDVYELYSKKEIEHVNNGDTSNIVFMIYKGLSPFYAFPDKKQISIEEPLTYIPFVEFVVGYLFNAAFVGFFISYLVSKLIIYEDKKTMSSTPDDLLPVNKLKAQL